MDGYASLLYENAKTPYHSRASSKRARRSMPAASDREMPEGSKPERRPPGSARRRRSIFRRKRCAKPSWLCILKGFKHVRRPNSEHDSRHRSASSSPT
ncbi:MAG: hypothetical protein MZU95_08155 [Desulfomicrobium escambiense]|nr:hypothetical protein [Desulfomicrobium escambiense]